MKKINMYEINEQVPLKELGEWSSFMDAPCKVVKVGYVIEDANGIKC